jgi:hypothetical protein
MARSEALTEQVGQVDDVGVRERMVKGTAATRGSSSSGVIATASSP